MVDPELEARIVTLERAVAALQQRDVRDTPTAPAPVDGDDTFWALTELERRSPGTVQMTGSVEVPEAGAVRWQVTQHGDTLLQQDWTEVATTLDALAHPARLSILRLVMTGVRTTADLLQQETVGTTGQLHHHLRQLVAAGWLTSPRRGHYEVPAPRVVPLLITVLSATR